MCGRLRAAREAQRTEHDATVADWQRAGLLLSAPIAKNYFEISKEDHQLRLLKKQIENGQTLFDSTELRIRQAQTFSIDILQQSEQLTATKTRVPNFEACLLQLNYAINVFFFAEIQLI